MPNEKEYTLPMETDNSWDRREEGLSEAEYAHRKALARSLIDEMLEEIREEEDLSIAILQASERC
jgi:hypothetical protein